MTPHDPEAENTILVNSILQQYYANAIYGQ